MSTTKNAAAEMSFLEHLDELRTRLVKCAIAVAVFFVIGWFFSEQLFNFLSVPVKDALARSRASEQTTVSEVKGDDLASVTPGTELQYTFPAAVRVGDQEVPAGTTIVAKINKT